MSVHSNKTRVGVSVRPSYVKLGCLGHAQRASWDTFWGIGAGTACRFDGDRPHSESHIVLLSVGLN